MEDRGRGGEEERGKKREVEEQGEGGSAGG